MAKIKPSHAYIFKALSCVTFINISPKFSLQWSTLCVFCIGGAVESHSEKHESVSLQQFTNLPHSNYSLCILMQSTLPTPQNTPEPHPKILESGSEPVLSPGPDVALLNPGIHQVHLAAFLKVLLSR